ncbi:MAG: ABC transporter ATP-binding protein [Chloroflexota bacterium]|nr:ABC transporter ATP-binding protein [Chloroflexota bacterium]
MTANNDPQRIAGTEQTAVPAIEFEHVTKRFPGTNSAAVNDVSLIVPQGNLVVLLGPSGCGKTTLLKMVNRLYEHDSGRILVEGHEARSFKVTELRRRIGYVIQSTGLFPHMTVLKNIGSVPEMLGWSRAKIEARADELLELVGLPPGEYRNRYPSQLSGGQQQRVGLARAMAADPSIMLMDEPFAAIDNITRRRLQDELLRIQGQVRKTILFVTHDVDEAIRLADRIAVMRQGKVEQYDTPLHILSAPASAFVATLAGSEDVLRRLSLLTVESAMNPAGQGNLSKPIEEAPTLDAGSSLRDALNLLLSKGTHTLSIIDSQRRTIGTVDLEGIQRVTRGHERSIEK